MHLSLKALKIKSNQSKFCDIESQWGKVKGQLWAEVTQVTIWGHMSFTQYAPSHMRPFLFECHISLCYIFAVEEVRGH